MKTKMQKLLRKNKLSIIRKIFTLLLLTTIFSCSKDDASNNPAVETPPAIIFKITDLATFSYKTYYQEVANATNRKGIVILSHGTGGNSDDSLLNDQCKALAEAGYIGVTTSYSNAGATYYGKVSQFKTDIEQVTNEVKTKFNIPINKIVFGGLSQGGNYGINMFLPDNANTSATTLNYKGVILMCSGGDSFKGSSILKPVIFMSNKIDNTVSSPDTTTFRTGLLANNNNTDVKTLSSFLIFDTDGHCTNSDQYKAFMVGKIKEWLP